MKLKFYMTSGCRFRDLAFSFEGHSFTYSGLPPQIRFDLGQARMALLKKSAGGISVWADGIKLGDYGEVEQIPEGILREAVLLGLQALAFESQKIDAERYAGEERFVAFRLRNQVSF
jgi:hypothetical protein